MILSAEWVNLFHDVILTALWRYLQFLFNFKEVIYVQYLYQIVQSKYNVFAQLILKENKRKLLSQGTYMSLAQSTNQGHVCP
jgi:hypothetical protein